MKGMVILGIILIIFGAISITLGVLAYLYYMIIFFVPGVPTLYVAIGQIAAGAGLIVGGILILVFSSD